MPILSKKTGYIDYESIFEKDVQIYMILGQRSDGKTYGAIQDSIRHYAKTGVPSAYIRRFQESITKTLVQDLVRPHLKTIEKETGGEYTHYDYKSKRFYFSDAEGNKDADPFLYAYAMNTWENAKGPDSGEFHNIIFDEYVSASKYLPFEYATFQNVLSSILRNRGNSRLIMLGNPINQICPYFDEFNIKPHEMKPNDIVYRVSEDGFKMKFIYVPPMSKTHRQSDSFLSFGKNRDKSITSGYWEFGNFIHPHGGLVKNSDHLFSFAIEYRYQYAVCDFYATPEGIVFCVFRPAYDNIGDKDLPLFTDKNTFAENVYLSWERDNPITQEFEKCVKSNHVLFATNQIGNLVKMWYDDFVRNSGRFLK